MSLDVPEGRISRRSRLFWFSRLPLFARCTLRSELRRRDYSLQRRSTRRDLFTDLNGRSRGSQGKALFWLQSINRPGGLLERECCSAPETNNLMVLLSNRIRSGVSNQALARRSRFPLSLRPGQSLRRQNERHRNRQFFTRY